MTYWNRMTRRAVLGAGFFAGTSLLLKACGQNSPNRTTTQTSGGNLIATCFAGSWEQFHREVLVPAFVQATGGSVTLVPMVSLEQVAQLTASPQNPPFDVVLLDEGPFNASAKEQLFEPLPVDLVENYDQVLSELQNPEGWGPTTGVQVMGIAYNPALVSTPPTSWQDLWAAQYRGRVSMQGMQTTQGTSLMVQIAKMNGGSETNIAPAFAALRELRPNLAGIAPNAGALATLFQQEEIAIAPHDLNNVMALKARGASIDWVMPTEGGIALRPAQQIVKNTSADIALAAALINAALSTEVQTAMAAAPYYFLPSNRNVPLSGVLAEKLGNRSAEVLEKLVLLDWNEINKNRSAWIEQFDREVQV
ncbi:extracellular solute-binding protein [Desertifilum sp. FACHB-1129]|uniref:ABC transporter substrate-binding protein n=1 Tax=Desertifilum tharense IPPAS B-1220 TaxID=1781255 RepID=A0A1E5QHQ2_9CYAN|nr:MULTISPECIES: extracellular solute-binding protein [Desertifilum]MDA0211298.1 extracellular solute-binding protein [Cyanobacteria bacterium FC1]MBD2314680.1 extracellular solute-binding protein [Desertifilum sp. FACHB-1129]MBD2320260.1 extracellular solute-binding protein [Desertifilum sp. FACHB-866]MBD2330388.1 extracellular solute-binding protein [Desertifilum sp. FACHB-868]OEJ74148.1 ABC transporter substrate-binding protein [Desertifilum tharense IPPAS B-1220]